MTQTTADPGACGVEHQDCVLESAVETFGSTCNVTLAPAAAEPAKDPAAKALLAVISLVGDIEWSLCLGLPGETATALAAKFAGFEIPFDSPDLGDAIGELANILGGTVKAKLDSRGVRADISLPTVMRGTCVEVLNLQGMPRARTFFESPCGPLWTEVVVGSGLVKTRRPGT